MLWDESMGLLVSYGEVVSQELVTSFEALGCSSEGFPTLVLVSSMLFGSSES